MHIQNIDLPEPIDIDKIFDNHKSTLTSASSRIIAEMAFDKFKEQYGQSILRTIDPQFMDALENMSGRAVPTGNKSIKRFFTVLLQAQDISAYLAKFIVINEVPSYTYKATIMHLKDYPEAKAILILGGY